MTTSGTPADAFDGSRHDIDGLSVFCVYTAPATSARPTVVAVHGIPESSLAWRDVAAAVGDSARMVIPDLPGFGRSDKPANYDYSLARQSRLLEAVLERVVPEAPIHLAVHDIGGPVGLMWAIRNPDRLASLLILNTTLFLELFRPPRVALISLVPVVGPRAVAATLSRESDFKRVILRPCARSIDPATLDALYDPYRQPDALPRRRIDLVCLSARPCRRDACAQGTSADYRSHDRPVRRSRPVLHSRQRPRVRIAHSQRPPAPARRCRALHSD